MKARFEHIDDYLEQARPDFSADLRTQAENDLRTFGFPALKTESWKYTNAKSLLREVYEPANDVSLDSAAVQNYFIADTERLVFVNGILSLALSLAFSAALSTTSSTAVSTACFTTFSLSSCPKDFSTTLVVTGVSGVASLSLQATVKAIAAIKAYFFIRYILH